MPDIEGCRVRVPSGAVELAFLVHNLNPGRRELQSEVSIDWEPRDGQPKSGRRIATHPLARQVVNWRSNSSCDNLQRRLASYYEGMALPWKAVVEWVASGVDDFIRRPMEIEEPEWVDAPVGRYRLRPLIPEAGVTIWFGPGDSGKGQMACCAAFAIAYDRALGPLSPQNARPDEPPWYYIDYEDSKREWDSRLTRLALGSDLYLPPGLRRIPGRLPLSEMVDRLWDQLGPDVGGFFVDSAMPATNGDVKEPEPVRQFFAATRRWQCPWVLIAHETKQDNDTYPYGNVFWHNLARATINFRSALKSPLERHILIRNRKRNNGQGFRDLGVSLTFSDDEAGEVPAWTRMRALPLSQLVGELQERRSLGDRAEAILLREPDQTIEELAQAMDARPASLKAVLNRDDRFRPAETVTKGGRGNTAHWRVIESERKPQNA